MKLARTAVSAFLAAITIIGAASTAQAATKQELNWTESVDIASVDNAQATDTLSFNIDRKSVV